MREEPGSGLAKQQGVCDSVFMARPLRLEFAGGLYHVTSRGDRREDIFGGDEDRLTWRGIFADVCERFNWVCHAYCLMSNHYHIVVETVEGNLAQGMRQLNGVYTQYVNRTHARVGHVFQGRYKAILVEKDSYLSSWRDMSCSTRCALAWWPGPKTGSGVLIGP